MKNERPTSNNVCCQFKNTEQNESTLVNSVVRLI